MQFILLTALGTTVLAYNSLPPNFAVLQIRQGGDAFMPGSSGDVENCPTPCGDQWCLDVPRGDTCCSEGYACPGGSFCLTQGFCCPSGEDPKSCAAANGVTLPTSFSVGDTVAPSFSAAPSTLSPSAGSTSSAAIVTSSAAITPSYPIPGKSTVAIITASAGSLATSTPVPFTGGAGAVRYSTVGSVVALVFGSLGLAL